MLKFFSQFPELVAACSTMTDGNMSFTRPEPDVVAHREKFLRTLGLSLDSLVVGEQPHGRVVRLVTLHEAGSGSRNIDSVLPGVEGLITQTPGVTLGVTVADCVPIYLFEPNSKTIGLIHSGWRSAVDGIVPSILTQLTDIEVGLSTVQWFLGPHIQNCCFTVRADSIDRFAAYPEHIRKVGDVWHVSLAGILKQQLLQAGVSSSTIEISPLCTGHDDGWYSYRRSQGHLAGGQLAVLGLRMV